jgi:ferredoxin--NADP+ reductase
MTARAAVVGAGPSGFYAADALLKAGVAVDMFDALPTPYGLVRAGVAPDHPKIKTVTRIYDKTASHPGFRFFGGVELGADVTPDELLERYRALVYAVGTPADNRLGIPGDDRPGSVAAGEFVAWYNGHPAYAQRAFDLSCERAVVIGNGNVAIDVARMLVLGPDALAGTDAADHALAALADARVSEVVILGRRGPAQAAFTTPELRELGELARAEVVVDADDLEPDPFDASPIVRRNLAVLRELAARPPAGERRRPCC